MKQKSSKDLASPSDLREVFAYDPETGAITLKSTGALPGSRGYHKSGKPNGIIIKYKGFRIRAHRLAFALVTGAWPSGQVDHGNCNNCDNRWANLREASNMQNSWNRRAYNRHGVKGVWRNGKGWQASITVNSHVIRLGTHGTKGLAAVARAKAAIRYHGKFARLT